MKNKLLFLLLLLLPFIVKAQQCTIVSGNGKDIGSELECGTEHFYIVSSTDTEIKMLAKYNLFVGDKIDYFDVEDDTIYDYYSDNVEDLCFDYAEEKGYNPYYVHPMTTVVSNSYPYTIKLDGCRVYENIEYNHIRQDERAIGTKLVDGKSQLPLYGIVYMNGNWGYNAVVNNDIRNNEYDTNGNLALANTEFADYLYGYREELESQKIEVEDVSFFTLSKVLKLLKDLSGEDVSVQLTYPSIEESDYYEFYFGKMNIKNFVNNNNWIYGTTYWLGSGFYGDPSDTSASYYNDFYISNEGLLCAIGRGECQYLPYPIGNGIRPLVTISKSKIKYNIKTKTDGKGTIEVVESAYGGQTIDFIVSAQKGYKIKELIVVTDSGETVTFTEEELSTNSDGTISISSNKFTMPFENVTIEAKWASTIINPNTGNYILVFIIVLIISVLSGLFFNRKKKGIPRYS